MVFKTILKISLSFLLFLTILTLILSFSLYQITTYSTMEKQSSLTIKDIILQDLEQKNLTKNWPAFANKK
jgi:hypothetical protein